MKNLTPEQAKHNRIVREYTELVTSTDNHIGLCGHQPRLTKIRDIYKTGRLSESDLELVLHNLAIQLEGEPEPFKNKEHAFRTMFGKLAAQPSPQMLSTAEQAIKIKDIMGDELKKKSYSGPRRKKAVKKEEAINVSALPTHLQHLAR